MRKNCFKDKVKHLKAVYFDPSLANEAKEAILVLSDSLNSGFVIRHRYKWVFYLCQEENEVFT